MDDIVIFDDFITSDEYKKLKSKLKANENIINISKMIKEMFNFTSSILKDHTLVGVRCTKEASFSFKEEILLGINLVETKKKYEFFCGKYECQYTKNLDYDYYNELIALVQSAGFEYKYDLVTESYNSRGGIDLNSVVEAEKESKRIREKINYYVNNNKIVNVISDDEVNKKYSDTDKMLKSINDYIKEKEK